MSTTCRPMGAWSSSLDGSSAATAIAPISWPSRWTSGRRPRDARPSPGHGRSQVAPSATAGHGSPPMRRTWRSSAAIPTVKRHGPDSASCPWPGAGSATSAPRASGPWARLRGLRTVGGWRSRPRLTHPDFWSVPCHRSVDVAADQPETIRRWPGASPARTGAPTGRVTRIAGRTCSSWMRSPALGRARSPRAIGAWRISPGVRTAGRWHSRPLAVPTRTATRGPRSGRWMWMQGTLRTLSQEKSSPQRAGPTIRPGHRTAAGSSPSG